MRTIDINSDLGESFGVNGNGASASAGHRSTGHGSAGHRSASHDYRGYAGQVASGVLRAGDEVVLLPSEQHTRIAAIDTYDGPLESAFAPLSVTLRLEDDLDVSRGEIICGTGATPVVSRDLTAAVCWMSERRLRAGDRMLIKHTTRTVPAIVADLRDRVDVETLGFEPAAEQLELNDIGHVTLRTSAPLVFDPYRVNRATGSFILIDEATNGTVAAGLIESGDRPG